MRDAGAEIGRMMDEARRDAGAVKDQMIAEARASIQQERHLAEANVAAQQAQLATLGLREGMPMMGVD